MKSVSAILVVIVSLVFMSCENPMSFHTQVNEDGSLDKTITFEKARKDITGKNIFGISGKNGWVVKQSLSVDTLHAKDEEKFRIQFDKHFASVEEMNRELDNSTDTLFHVHSKFEKKFRWFYTYIRYSETVRPVNRFKTVSARDYFNYEDSLFIRRLPPEGKTVSKADSIYLQLLNDKITERFATMAIFKEIIKIMEEVVRKNSADKKWLDTLAKHQELIYNVIEKDKGNHHLAEKIADTLSIPLEKTKANRDFAELSRDLNSRVDFMSFARDGKYRSEFEMPWAIVASNADSIAGNTVYWRPLVHKFLYMDYEMYAECRKLNAWAVIVSAIVVGFTVFLLWRNAQN